MSDFNTKQVLLSENLLLLQELGYVCPEPKSFHKTTQIELELLDTIASVLTTKRGDTFAATFDKGNDFIELILAKSGKPTMEDKQFAKEFFSLIIDPNVKNATAVFPFLLEHRCDYLNMRIKKLHAISTDAQSNEYFNSALDYYVAECTDPSPEVQFPRRHSNFDKNKCYDSLLKEYLTQIQEYSKRDLDDSGSEAHDMFFNLYYLLDTLASSAFMQDLKGHGGQSRVGRSAGKFIRHAEKLGRYIRGVKCILQYAKRLFASGAVVPHRWIEDTLIKTGEGEIQFRAKNAHEVACRVRRANALPTNHLENLDKVCPSNREPWKPLFAYTHPELRIVLSSLPPKGERGGISRAIGLSKQPCLSCMFWIKYYNEIMSTNWVMGGLWGKPDPTFTLPGEADPVNSHATDDIGHEGNDVDPYVQRDIFIRLESELKWILKRGAHGR